MQANPLGRLAPAARTTYEKGAMHRSLVGLGMVGTILSSFASAGCGVALERGPTRIAAGASTAGDPGSDGYVTDATTYTSTYVEACRAYENRTALGGDEAKPRGALLALLGQGADPSGKPFESASGALTRLHASKLAARVDDSDKSGWPGLRFALMDEYMQLAEKPEKTTADQKRMLDLGKRVAGIQAIQTPLSAHLSALHFTSLNTNLHG